MSEGELIFLGAVILLSQKGREPRRSRNANSDALRVQAPRGSEEAAQPKARKETIAACRTR